MYKTIVKEIKALQQLWSIPLTKDVSLFHARKKTIVNHLNKTYLLTAFQGT